MRTLAVILALLLGLLIGATGARLYKQARAEDGAASRREITPQRIRVVDGDSVSVDGHEWRLMGFDTPEIDKAHCEGEQRAGRLAKRRLEELVGQAQRIEVINSGTRDRYKRVLGELMLDGRNVREIMLTEGYARPYNGGWRKGWCSRDSRDDLVPGLPPARR